MSSTEKLRYYDIKLGDFGYECGNCGAEVNEEDTVCLNCGQHITNPVETYTDKGGKR